MAEEDSSRDLAREINAPLLAVYGAGTILGAGIYILIGKIAGEAGYWAPLAFLAAALVAGVNGLVFAELATRRPRAGGPSAYAQGAFGRPWLSIAIGWMVVATGVVSAAAITTGFSGYVTHFVDWPEWIPRAGLLVGLGAVAVAGAKESAWFMAVTTTLGVAGLLFVMYVGFFDGGAGADLEAYANELPSLADLGVLVAVMTGAFLAVYSFIGFEDVVHMAEEARNPSRSIPFAIVVAVLAALVLYVLVSLAALIVLSPDALAQSKAPLIDVVTAAGYPDWPLALLSVWVILNGALAQLIMATRVIYSLGQKGGAPAFLARVSGLTDTPVLATVLSTAAALALALFFPIKTLATATSFIILLVFATANASLIVLERRNPEAPFDIPRIVPWVGLTLCIALLAGKLAVSGGGH